MSKFVRATLKGVNEEERDVMIAPDTPGGAPTPAKRREVVAQLEGYDLFTYVAVPVELVGDAKIGDEFEIHLERSKKK